MADVTATGALSKAQRNIRTLLAASATFRTWVGAANPAAALLRLHLCEVEPLSVTRPCGAIYMPRQDGGRWTKEYGGGSNTYDESGRCRVAFFADLAVAGGIAATVENYELTFSNAVGSILDEIMDLSNTDVYINIREIRVVNGPHRTAREEEHATPYFWIELDMEWGY